MKDFRFLLFIILAFNSCMANLPDASQLPVDEVYSEFVDDEPINYLSFFSGKA